MWQSHFNATKLSFASPKLQKMPIRDSLNANAKLNNYVNLAKQAFTKFYLIHNQNVDQILNLRHKKSFDLIGKNCSNFFSKNSV